MIVFGDSGILYYQVAALDGPLTLLAQLVLFCPADIDSALRLCSVTWLYICYLDFACDQSLLPFTPAQSTQEGKLREILYKSK